MIEKKKPSQSFLEARTMLPPELHPVLDQLVSDYKFAALKVYGSQMVSQKVIAELILLGWRYKEHLQDVRNK